MNLTPEKKIDPLDKDLELLQKERSLKPNTIKAYKINITKLALMMTGKEYLNTHFLNNFDKFKEILVDKTLSQKRTYTSLALTFINFRKVNWYDWHTKEYADEATDLNKQYHKLNTKFRLEFDTIANKQQKSEKQKTNWVEWTKILKFQNKMKQKITRDKYSKKNKLTLQQQKYLRDYLIVSLYTLARPRRLDYHNMIIMSQKNYKILGENQKDSNILITHRKKAKMFSFGMNVQKNANAGNNVCQVVISKKLRTVINLYLKFHTDKHHLLLNGHLNKPIEIDGLSRAVKRIMSNEFDGKNIGVTDLRTIYKTHWDKEGKSILEKQKCAEEMGHSSSVGEKTYTKKD